MRLHGLSRQVAISMAFVTTATVLITYLAYYVFYFVIMRYFPEHMPASGELAPPGVDLIVLAAICVAGLFGAAMTAYRLARRITAPLNSLAQAARSIATGDLAARAQPGDRSLGETALLVDDFNSMAERLERTAKDIVVWNVQIAHELRTPLTILRGRLQGLSDGVFEPDPELFRRLLNQVDGLTRLVEDLRVVSLADSGHLELQRTVVELAEEIEDLAILMEPSLTRAGFTVRLDLQRGRACLDIARIRQATMALIDNAQCHADPCELVMKLKMNDDHLILQVIDQGPGLPEAFAGRAFELFARASNDSGRRRSGSGLGLSVIQAIARAHCGDVACSNNARGAIFTMTLPRCSDHQP